MEAASWLRLHPSRVTGRPYPASQSFKDSERTDLLWEQTLRGAAVPSDRVLIRHLGRQVEGSEVISVQGVMRQELGVKAARLGRSP